MISAASLGEPASVEWDAIPEFAQMGERYDSEIRAFETLRDAVRFVVENLPRQQQPTAKIHSDSGQTYDFANISLIYRSAEFDSVKRFETDRPA